MNSENNKTPKSHVLLLKLTNKLDLRIGEKNIALSNLSIYYKWKNINPNDKIELSDGSHSVSDIQHYFEYIKKTWRRY